MQRRGTVLIRRVQLDQNAELRAGIQAVVETFVDPLTGVTKHRDKESRDREYHSIQRNILHFLRLYTDSDRYGSDQTGILRSRVARLGKVLNTPSKSPSKTELLYHLARVRQSSAKEGHGDSERFLTTTMYSITDTLHERHIRSLLREFQQRRLWDAAVELTRRARSRGVKVERSTLSSFLISFGRTGRVDAVKSVMDELIPEKKRRSSDYRGLICAYCAANRYDDALDLMTVCKDDDEAIKGFNYLLSRDVDIQTALKAEERRVQLRIAPDADYFGHLFQAFKQPAHANAFRKTLAFLVDWSQSNTLSFEVYAQGSLAAWRVGDRKASEWLTVLASDHARAANYLLDRKCTLLFVRQVGVLLRGLKTDDLLRLASNLEEAYGPNAPLSLLGTSLRESAKSNAAQIRLREEIYTYRSWPPATFVRSSRVPRKQDNPSLEYEPEPPSFWEIDAGEERGY